MDGAWSQWTPWTQCSVNCGDGVQERLRYCDDPAPSNGGTKCDGLAREEKACNMSACSGITLASLMQNCALYCQSLGNRESCFNLKTDLFMIRLACKY